MKENVLSNCEQNFVNRAIKENRRLDGRNLLEARPVKIYFGSQWGCCVVSLGQTRAIAQVTCDIQQPKASRPNEGMIHINVDINPLAAQHFESGRQSDVTMLINRQLERCIKDSNCVDLESLCIVADKKVWNLRVDINIINHDGSLVDCAVIAAITALSHFHRPDVTSTGDDIIIHPYYEKDPLPLTLYHHPVSISFLAYECGNIIMDPTYIEERIGVAQLTLGVNAYKQLCSLHFDYLTKTLTVQDVMSAVLHHAGNYACQLIDQIKAAVANDIQARYNKDNTNTYRLRECIRENKLTTMMSDCISIKLCKWDVATDINVKDIHKGECDNNDSHIKSSAEGSAELIIGKHVLFGEGGASTWDDSFESSDDEAVDIVPIEQVNKKGIITQIDLSCDSEEEKTEIVSSDHLKQ